MMLVILYARPRPRQRQEETWYSVYIDYNVWYILYNRTVSVQHKHTDPDHVVFIRHMEAP